MKRSIILILFAFADFLFTSCDRAEAKTKDYTVKYAPPGTSETVTVIVSLPSFGILPEKVQMQQTVVGYPVITVIGQPRDKHGFSGFNYLQCRKS